MGNNNNQKPHALRFLPQRPPAEALAGAPEGEGESEADKEEAAGPVPHQHGAQTEGLSEAQPSDQDPAATES